MGVIAFLIAVTVLVAWHELGHYLAFMAFGIPVKTFSVGIGTEIVGHTAQNGTRWRVGILPIGGYVMPKMIPAVRAAAWKKFTIAAAGPFFNLLLFLIPGLYFGVTDQLVKILWHAYLAGYAALGEVLIRPFVAVWSWFHTVPAAHDAAIGPIGMASQAANTTNEITIRDGSHARTLSGFPVVLATQFVMLNIAIILFNLIPIPVLDGGRMVLAIIEGIFGRKPAKAFNDAALVVGGILIIYLFVVITVSDIIGLFR